MPEESSPATVDPAQAMALMAQADLLKPMAIRVTATLKIVDIILAGQTSTADMAQRTGTSAHHLRLLLAYLSTIGLVDRQGEDDWSTTAQGELLASDHPAGLRRVLDNDGGVGRSHLGLVGLEHTIRTGATSHESVFGKAYWDGLNEDPDSLEPMRLDGNRGPVFGAEEFIDGFDWSGYESVIDIGGNNGMVLISLLKAHGHLRGATLDLPNLSRIAEREIEEAGLADRAESLSGSFFEPLPTGYDVYLLSAILNDWTDSQAVEILRNVAAAAGKDGTIILGEVNLRYDMLSPNVEEVSLSMSTVIPAPVRSAEQYRDLARQAGLDTVSVREENPLRSVFVLRPAAGNSTP